MENKEIMLTKEQRKQLEAFTKSGVHSARLITRARVILALDRTGKVRTLRHREICEQERISRTALNDIRRAFIEAPDIAAFLTRKERETPPVQPKITGEVEAKIIATACSAIPEGYARWSITLLTKRVIELGFIDSISETSVRTVLKKHHLSLI